MGFFFVYVLIMSLSASLKNSSIYTVGQANDNFFGLSTMYMVMMVFFTYCEFSTAVVFYTPLYLVTVYIVTIA